MGELQAGRELDALIAEQVLDWKTKYAGIDKTVPPYSTDIAAAWLVVEGLWPDWEFDIDLSFVRRGAWLATFNNGGIAFDAEAETAPLAICRAAVKVWRVR